MKKNIYNSSGKTIGEIVFQETKIDIVVHNKYSLTIVDPSILKIARTRRYDKETLLTLYDDYTLSIGVIAAVYDVHYHTANLWIKDTEVTTGIHSGRRNSSYAKKFPPSRLKNMSTGQKGKKVYNNGAKERWFKEGEKIPEGFVEGRLPFSEEMKAKLRTIIIHLQNEGVMKKGKEAAQLGWKNGKFKEVNFKRGIGGWITSTKISLRFFFRSLLELYYILMLEKDPTIETYQYEPFIIQCENGTMYTPDFLINNSTVVELKSKKFIYGQGGEIQEKFEYKVQQAKKYCEEHGYVYEVIFDEDINFDSTRFKHEIRESSDLQDYNIQFAQPERVWSKKQQDRQKIAQE